MRRCGRSRRQGTGKERYDCLINEVIHGKIFIQDYHLLLEYKEQMLRTVNRIGVSGEIDQTFRIRVNELVKHTLILCNLAHKTLLGQNSEIHMFSKIREK